VLIKLLESLLQAATQHYVAVWDSCI